MKIEFSRAAWANRVIEDLNFKSSGLPKISLKLRPSIDVTSRLHSMSRAPRRGCSKYDLASAREVIP